MREDKLIRSGTGGDIERSLVLAIRRANGEAELLKLAEQVAGLSKTAVKTRDAELMETVGRLLRELRAAVGQGPKLSGPILETKDCAAPLLRTELKFTSSKKRASMEVNGYASTFGGEPDSYGDVIERGAYSKTLARHRAAGTLPKLFWSHSPAQVPGRWLEMREDSHGLVAEGKLSQTSLGKDLDILIDDGAIDALSIGFVIPPGGAKYQKDVRIISEIELHEVSLVSLPANPRARLKGGSGATDSFSEALEKLKRLLIQQDAADDKRDNVVVPFSPRGETADETELRRAAERISRSINQSLRTSR